VTNTSGAAGAASTFRVERLEVVAAHVSPPPEQAALRALRGEWVFVVAHGPDGLRGYGEATHSSDDDACAARVRGEWTELLVGRTLPSGAGDLGRWLDRIETPAHDRVATTAHSAVEQALCDLAARRAGLPLATWLSHGSEPGDAEDLAVPLYATLNRGIFDRSPEGFAAAAKRAVTDGFRTLKCAPFDGVVKGGAPDGERTKQIALGLERLSAVRQAVGPDVRLMVDCHGRFLEDEAIQVARDLARFDLSWLEEPVPFEPDPQPLARVRRKAPMPIAAGELMFRAQGFRPLLDAEAVDVIMPDVKHCGGLLPLLQIAREAEARGVRVAPHNPSGPISTLSSAHACVALSTAPEYRLLEYAWGEVPWRPSLLDPPEAITDGVLRLPPGPGLGASLNETTLQTYPHSL
jgi:galactonate dehydratase